MREKHSLQILPLFLCILYAFATPTTEFKHYGNGYHWKRVGVEAFFKLDGDHNSKLEKLNQMPSSVNYWKEKRRRYLSGVSFTESLHV